EHEDGDDLVGYQPRVELLEQGLKKKGSISPCPVEIQPFGSLERTQGVSLEKRREIVSFRIVVLRDPKQGKEEQHKKDDGNHKVPAQEPRCHRAGCRSR